MEYGYGIYCNAASCHPCGCHHLSEMGIFIRENEPLVDELVDIKKQRDELERKEKALKNKLLGEMQRHHIKFFETDSARVSSVDDCNTEKVNTKKLKEMYPSIYYRCCESGYREGYLIVRMK